MKIRVTGYAEIGDEYYSHEEAGLSQGGYEMVGRYTVSELGDLKVQLVGKPPEQPEPSPERLYCKAALGRHGRYCRYFTRVPEQMQEHLEDTGHVRHG